MIVSFLYKKKKKKKNTNYFIKRSGTFIKSSNVSGEIFPLSMEFEKKYNCFKKEFKSDYKERNILKTDNDTDWLEIY